MELSTLKVITGAIPLAFDNSRSDLGAEVPIPTRPLLKKVLLLFSDGTSHGEPALPPIMTDALGLLFQILRKYDYITNTKHKNTLKSLM